MGTLLIKQSKIRNLKMFLGCLMFILISLGFVIVPIEILLLSIFVKTMGVIGVIFFSFLSFRYLINLVLAKPGIIATNAGIQEFTTNFNWGVIEWNDIKELKLRKFKGSALIDVIVTDLVKYNQRLGFVNRLLTKRNKDLNFSIVINMNLIKGDPQEVLTKLNQYLEKN